MCWTVQAKCINMLKMRSVCLIVNVRGKIFSYVFVLWKMQIKVIASVDFIKNTSDIIFKSHDINNIGIRLLFLSYVVWSPLFAARSFYTRFFNKPIPLNVVVRLGICWQLDCVFSRYVAERTTIINRFECLHRLFIYI